MKEVHIKDSDFFISFKCIRRFFKSEAGRECQKVDFSSQSWEFGKMVGLCQTINRICHLERDSKIDLVKLSTICKGKWNLKLENDFSPKEVEAVIIHYSIWTRHSGRQESVILKLESVLAFFIHLIECFNINVQVVGSLHSGWMSGLWRL